MRKMVLSVLTVALSAGVLVGCGSSGSKEGGGKAEKRTSNSVIYDAARVNDIAAIKEAVASGVPVDAVGKGNRTGLFIAVYGGQLAAANTLLDLGADPTAAADNGRTPLMYAADKRYNELLKKMLAKKPDVNAQDKGGMTAAHIAANIGNITAYNLLKAAGADLTLRDRRGRTPEDIMGVYDMRRDAAEENKAAREEMNKAESTTAPAPSSTTNPLR